MNNTYLFYGDDPAVTQSSGIETDSNLNYEVMSNKLSLTKNGSRTLILMEDCCIKDT